MSSSTFGELRPCGGAFDHPLGGLWESLSDDLIDDVDVLFNLTFHLGGKFEQLLCHVFPSYLLVT